MSRWRASRWSEVAAVAIALALTTGCNEIARLDRFRIRDAGPDASQARDGGPTDGGSARDGGRDAGPPPDAGTDACGPEVCNELDDDCDGAVDEDFDLSTDRGHCGACNAACDGVFCRDGGCVRAEQIAAGGFFTCALLSNGELWCWGDNMYGQLGDGTMTPHSSPTRVDGLSNVVRVAAGNFHACAVVEAGGRTELHCWGDNRAGQLGLGSMTIQTEPMHVSSLTNPSDALGGAAHTCAASGPGLELRCWGSNSVGQLGNGTSGGPNVTSPPATPAISNVRGVFDSRGGSTCVFTPTGPSCWGRLVFTEPYNGTPTSVDFGGVVADIAPGGGGFVCAAMAEGAVMCFGSNSAGQLGNGGFADAPSPTAVVDVVGATAVSAASASACALTSGGVYCWGESDATQLGRSLTSDTARPVIVEGVDGTALTSGGAHHCAIARTGDVWCWGANDRGQLGRGATSAGEGPAPVVWP